MLQWMNKKSKKLRISTDTVRSLTQEQLPRVQGGGMCSSEHTGLCHTYSNPCTKTK